MERLKEKEKDQIINTPIEILTEIGLSSKLKDELDWFELIN